MKAILTQGAQNIIYDSLNFDLQIKLDAYTGDFPAPFNTKTADELQEGVAVSTNGVITGKLFYNEWTEFSSKPEEQQGYYVSLITTVPEGVAQGDFTFELIGGTKGVVDNSDGIFFFLINEKSKGLILNVKKGEETKTFNYTFDFTFVPQDEEVEAEPVANMGEE